ncbi:MAG TPA: DUF488 domain-containing protein [Thermomicrobiales bacterium]|nr:DUF488 domain-containing protein [Thermomicrobiales bacterium]
MATIDDETGDARRPAEGLTADGAGEGPDWGSAAVYTIGHSTRTQAELIDLLRTHGVMTLADVRRMPRSRRNPQFNEDALAEALPAAGIAYVHLPRLGGLRRGVDGPSPNGGWRNASFRAYADYMQTADFAEGLDDVRRLAAAGPVALMCAEAVPWRCHRSLIADALVARGVDVREIASGGRATPHHLPSFARVDGTRVTYPAPPVDGDHP